MWFVWVNGFSFFHSVASPFHSFVTIATWKVCAAPLRKADDASRVIAAASPRRAFECQHSDATSGDFASVSIPDTMRLKALSQALNSVHDRQTALTQPMV